MSELDNPVWWAITGSQHELATATSLAGRFDPDVSPFGAFSEEPTPDHWGDLARLVGPGGTVALTGAIGRPPAEWRVLLSIPGRPDGRRPGQLGPGDATDRGVAPGQAPTARRGGRSGHAGPGGRGPTRTLPPPHGRVRRLPRRPSTRSARGHGRRASAPARLRRDQRRGHGHRPPAPGARRAPRPSRGGVGLARGEMPFLHASSENTVAVRLYERLGFTLRREVSFLVLEAPG